MDTFEWTFIVIKQSGDSYCCVVYLIDFIAIIIIGLLVVVVFEVVVVVVFEAVVVVEVVAVARHSSKHNGGQYCMVFGLIRDEENLLICAYV